MFDKFYSNYKFPQVAFPDNPQLSRGQESQLYAVGFSGPEGWVANSNCVVNTYPVDNNMNESTQLHSPYFHIYHKDCFSTPQYNPYGNFTLLTHSVTLCRRTTILGCQLSDLNSTGGLHQCNGITPKVLLIDSQTMLLSMAHAKAMDSFIVTVSEVWFIDKDMMEVDWWGWRWTTSPEERSPWLWRASILSQHYSVALHYAIDAGGSANISGNGVERMMALRDKVKSHIQELQCDFQTANLFSSLFLNTEMKKDRPSSCMLKQKSNSKWTSK